MYRFDNKFNSAGKKMKKWIVIWSLIIFCFLSGCSESGLNNEPSDKEPLYLIDEATDTTDSNYIMGEEKEEMQVDMINRTIIAKALGVEENNRNIRFILNSLNTIEAGKIQSAEMGEIGGEKVINLVAEDSINYRIYLSRSGSVEAVKNLDTDEWVIQSGK